MVDRSIDRHYLQRVLRILEKKWWWGVVIDKQDLIYYYIERNPRKSLWERNVKKNLERNGRAKDAGCVLGRENTGSSMDRILKMLVEDQREIWILILRI